MGLAGVLFLGSCPLGLPEILTVAHLRCHQREAIVPSSS